MRGQVNFSLGTMIGTIGGAVLYSYSLDGVLFAAGCSTGVILPDIDVKNSIISKKIPIVSFVVRLFVKHRKKFIHLFFCL